MQTRADEVDVYMYLHILFTKVSGINKVSLFMCLQGVETKEETL